MRDFNWKSFPRQETANGLSYFKYGRGKPLVLLHGVGLRAECWFNQISAFSKRYQVFALDMPGHGHDQSLPKNSIAPYIECLRDLIALEIGQPAMIIGHSMGALITVEFAAKYPELCSKFTAMNTVFKRCVDAKIQIKQRVGQLKNISDPQELLAPISRWFVEPRSELDKQAAKMCEYWLLQTNLDGYRNAYSLFAETDGPSAKALNQVQMPGLFLTGEFDLNSTPKMSENLANSCTNGIAKIIPGARHMPMLTHIESTNGAMLNFLDQK